MNMTSFPYYNVMAKAPAANITDQIASDYWLESGNYLNFDYLTVGWNIPRAKMVALYQQFAHLYVGEQSRHNNELQRTDSDDQQLCRQ